MYHSVSLVNRNVFGKILARGGFDRCLPCHALNVPTIHVVMDSAIERMTAERMRRGWTQRQAAERARISHATWSRIESGDMELSGRSRAAVAHAFDWPLDWPDVEPGAAPTSVSEFDALKERVADLEALVRALTRALLDDRPH